MSVMGESARPPVLFIPGFMQREDSWLEVAGAVSERYPAFIVDFDTWTFEQRLAEIQHDAAPGTVLCGYSMGGRLALHAALRDPGRYAALVTIGASAGIEDAGERAARREADDLLAAWIEANPIDAVVERWERNPVFASQSDGLVEMQREGRLRHDPHRLAVLLRSAGQGALEPVWDRLAELTMPVLALAGEHDDAYVGAGMRLAELSGGRFAAIPAAGHAAHLEAPRATASAVLDALDEHFGDRGLVDVDS
jgi:2-succinyl-6-hydroxy-2,4-cyclohexadiene-1-carboxylate synthase